MRLLFGWFFCLTALQHLVKPARNAFFLSTAGAENLPWAYIAAAGASLVATLAYGRWVAPLSRERLLLGTLGGIAGSLVLFRFVLGDPTVLAAGAFYVWFNVFSLFLVSQFFLLGNELFDPRQAKRLFGLIGAGGLAGGVAGAAGAGFLANEIGSANLIWIGVALLGVCAALAQRVLAIGRFHSTGPRPSRRSETSTDQGITGGLAILRRVPHLRRIAILLFLAIVSSTFVDWLYNSAVEAAHPGDPERQAEFIGQSFAIFNALAFFLQIFLTGFSLRVLGLAGSLLVLPVGLAMGTASVFLLPSIWTAAVARGADASLRYSIDQAAREILYLPVPTALKRRAKPFIDIVVQRGADGVAGVLILMGTAALSTRGFSLLTLGVILLWTLGIWGVRRTYRQALERLLSVRDIDLEEAVEAGLDSEAIRELRDELHPEADAVEVEFALELLSRLPRGVLQDEAIRLLEHPAPGVRAHAVEMLDPDGPARDAVGRLADDPDPRVRGRALLFLCRAEVNGRTPWPDEIPEDDPHVVEAALTCLLERGGEEEAEQAGRTIARLVRRGGDDAAPLRAACARVLGHLSPSHPLQRHLRTLLADPHPTVVHDALLSARTAPSTALVPVLLPRLESGETRPLARRALAALGEDGVPYCAAALRDPELSIEIRRWIPGIFVELGTPAAYRALLEGVPSFTRGKHRIYALKALNKMRRRHPGWEGSPELVREELDRELEISYDVERQLATLADARETGAIPRGPAEAYSEALEYHATVAIERAFRLQGLLYRPRTIYLAYVGLTGGNTIQAANAIELLETALDRDDAARLLPLIDPDLSPERRAAIGRRWYPLEERTLARDLERVFEHDEPWLQAYGVALAGAAFAERLGPELERLAASGDPLVRSLARHALENGGRDDVPMSSVEKAAALRHAELLEELGADDLLQLSAVAEERDFADGEFLFYQGEEGDYMYVILEGGIRVESEGTEVFTAGKGETIGTFSIFDRQPRSADAIAVGPTRTLALHRADVSQILADNFSLVETIFGYLTNIIRRMNEVVYSRGASEAAEAKEKEEPE